MDEAKAQAWKELTADLELYRFYVELILKAAAFVLFMTGAIVSYALAHANTPSVRTAIWLPVVVNIGMAIISFVSIGFAANLRETVMLIFATAPAWLRRTSFLHSHSYSSSQALLTLLSSSARWVWYSAGSGELRQGWEEIGRGRELDVDSEPLLQLGDHA